MPPSLSELKVLPSFCFAFKIPDNVTVTNRYHGWLFWSYQLNRTANSANSVPFYYKLAGWLTHTLLQRTLYSKGTLCIVTSCSKEQFASNWLVTVCSLTHFTPQHTLPPGMFFSSAQFAPQHPLLLKTPCSSTHFASQHTLLLRTLCSSAHFASKNTLLLGTLYSSTHFAS